MKLSLLKGNVFFCLTLLILSWVQFTFAQDAEEQGIAETMRGNLPDSERIRLRQLMEREPSARLEPFDIAHHYRNQYFAAQRLGDSARQLEFSRKYAEITRAASEVFQMRGEASYFEWRAEYWNGDRAKAFVLGETRFNEAYIDRVQGAVQLGIDYINESNLTRAEQFLEVADSSSRGRLERSSHDWHMRSMIEELRFRVLDIKGRRDDAFAAIKVSVDATDRAMAAIRPADRRPDSYHQHIGAHRNYWIALANRGELALAEAKAAEYVNSPIIRAGASGRVLAEQLTALAEIKERARKYQEVQLLSRKIVQLLRESQAPENSLTLTGSDMRLVNASIALGNPSEGAQICSVRIVRKNRIRASYCARAFLATGNTAEAIRLTTSNRDYVRRVYPPEHFLSVHADALHGMALLQDDNRNVEGRKLLVAAISRFPDIRARYPEAMQGIYPAQERMVLEAALKLFADEHAGAPDATSRFLAASNAFGVATQLRSSVVQQSTQEAAIRAAAGESGLADLVRELQDGQALTRVLYEYLNRQLSIPTQRQLPQVVAGMRERIDELERRQKQIESAIGTRFPAFRELTRPAVHTSKDIAVQLQSSEVFLLITPTADAAHVWAISREEVEYARVPIKAAELDADVGRLRASLEHNLKFDTASAAMIYRQLLAPVEKTFSGKSNLLVSISGSLAKLPFGVLLTEKARSDNLAEHPYLIRKMAVTHVVSPAAWLAQMRFPKPVQTSVAGFAGFADPIFSAKSDATKATTRNVRNLEIVRGRRSATPDAPAPIPGITYSYLSPLPETRDEVIAIATSLRASPERDVFFGSRATRDRVLQTRLDDRSVIVFATHGLMAGDLPTLDEPALALSITSESDTNPLLRLSDVLKLRLNADWVVLSACNTAASEMDSDEAFSGLGRGFFYAGARSLLLTHWAVETMSAMALTTRLFERYSAESGITRAEALRQTQLMLIESKANLAMDYSHPFFWASFALVGDGRR